MIHNDVLEFTFGRSLIKKLYLLSLRSGHSCTRLEPICLGSPSVTFSFAPNWEGFCRTSKLANPLLAEGSSSEIIGPKANILSYECKPLRDSYGFRGGDADDRMKKGKGGKTDNLQIGKPKAWCRHSLLTVQGKRLQAVRTRYLFLVTRRNRWRRKKQDTFTLSRRPLL